MPKPGPRTTTRYSAEFKAVAVRLTQFPGVRVKDVAESLYIHPFMLSRWRKEAREGKIMTNKITVAPTVFLAEPWSETHVLSMLLSGQAHSTRATKECPQLSKGMNSRRGETVLAFPRQVPGAIRGVLRMFQPLAK